MRVNVTELGSDSLERVRKILNEVPNGIYKASGSALKRAGQMAKTQAGRLAAEEYVISKGDFMRNVTEKTMIKSDGGGMSLDILYAGNVLSLLSFNTKYSRGGYLQTQIMRKSAGGSVDSAFVARIGGYLGIYERLGSSRFPVEQKYGPSTAHMLQNEEVVEKMDETIRENFDKRMEQEIYRILHGYGI